MLTAWIDEKKLEDKLEYFRQTYLGQVQSFMGKSLRPFKWSFDNYNSPHLFTSQSFLLLLSSIEILELTRAEKTSYQNYMKSPETRYLDLKGNPLFLFGDTAKHAIQIFSFFKLEVAEPSPYIKAGDFPFQNQTIDANASIPATAELPGTFSDKIPATSTIPATAELPGTFSDKIPATSTIHEIQTQNSKIKDYLMILKEFCNIFHKKE